MVLPRRAKDPSLGDGPTALTTVHLPALVALADASESSAAGLLVMPDEPPTLPGRSLPATVKLDPLPGRRDPDATIIGPLLSGEKTTLLEAADLSIGAKATEQTVVAADFEQTAIRQVFHRLGEPKERGRRRSSEELAPLAERSSFSASRLWLLLLGGLLAAAALWAVSSGSRQKRQQAELLSAARSAYALATTSGQLGDFAFAEARLRALIADRPTDGAALSARALVLSQALYELGEGPELPLPGPPPTAARWADETSSAVRQAEGEGRPSAIAAQIFLALYSADLTQAERQLGRLRSRKSDPVASEEGPALAPLPAGLPDYLASQLALLSGKQTEALLGLRSAVAQNPLPLWQRRLGYLLSRSGQDGEALPLLSAAAQKQPSFCGAQIDLLYVRGQLSPGATLSRQRPLLRALVDPPSVGPDPCGRGERARAALLSAELLLLDDPTARGEARRLLDRAQELGAATDVLLLESLATARLRSGDPQRAEVLSRAALTLVPGRRSTRLLLATALVQRGQGGEALTILEPLTGRSSDSPSPSPSEVTSASPADSEAQIVKAQALLAQNDTLEAQKLAQKLLANRALPAAVRGEAQLLLGQVYLQLQEPAAARRTLEPLIRQARSGATSSDPALSAELLLSAQTLWAQALLASRPPEPEDARALLEAVLGRAPERIEARLLLARLLRQQGMVEEADRQLQTILRSDEHYSPAQRELGGLLLQRGDYAKAQTIYRQLIKEEQDSELLLTAARAERLAGAAEPALTLLAGIKRSRGEVTSKWDEALLGERGRALLALSRCAEAATLLRAPGTDLAALRRPTLVALLMRADICTASGPQTLPLLAGPRALLGRLSPAWRSDPDVRIAEAELLLKSGQRGEARGVLEPLLTSLATLPPSSQGEEFALRQLGQHLLEGLPPAGK